MSVFKLQHKMLHWFKATATSECEILKRVFNTENYAYLAIFQNHEFVSVLKNI